MKFAYYPGCSLHSTSKEYDVSIKAVFNKLDIKLFEPDEWTCCGSSPAHALSEIIATSLPWQNINEVKKMDMYEVVAPCSACFARFKTAQAEVKNDPDKLRIIENVLEEKLAVDVSVYHPLEVFTQKLMLEKIPQYVEKDLSHLKIACYYGCLLTRPPKIMQFDECEYPQSMDNILKVCGCNTIDWSFKTDCCGAAFALTRTDIVHKLCNEIFDEAKACGADLIAVACPLCHANLDMRQSEIEKAYDKEFNIPILYFTQAMGLAFGISPQDLLLHKHLVSTKEILANV